jgi:L-xylulokinase
VEEIPPREFVPLFLPFLMASNVHPNARGCFIGMAASHSRKHLVRSIFEGIAFSHRYHFEKLMATRERKPSVIRLAGGAARAEVWAQMFADVMQIRVETISARETGALGCAIAAAVTAGEYASLDEASARMSTAAGVYEPDRSLAEIYDRKYAMYVRAISLLDGLWDDLQLLAEGE